MQCHCDMKNPAPWNWSKTRLLLELRREAFGDTGKTRKCSPVRRGMCPPTPGTPRLPLPQTVRGCRCHRNPVTKRLAVSCAHSLTTTHRSDFYLHADVYVKKSIRQTVLISIDWQSDNWILFTFQSDWQLDT